MNLHKKLTEWQDKQLISAETRQSIEHYEASRPRATDYIWRYGLVGLATLCVCLGILFIVAANWQAIPFYLKLGVHLVFNVGIGIYIFRKVRSNTGSQWQVEAPMLVLAAVQLSLMALIGQYLQIGSPIEDVMLFWWILISPMILLLGHSSASMFLFLGLMFYCIAAKLEITFLQAQPFILGAAIASYLLSTLSALKKHRPQWHKHLQYGGLPVILLMMTLLLIDPTTELANHASNTVQRYWNILFNVILIGIMGLYTHYSVNKHSSRNMFENQLIMYALAVSAIVPLIHLGIGLFDMIIFCGAFLGIIWISYNHERSKWMSIAIIVIAARMIFYFASLTENLLINGVVMMAIGLMALRIMKKFVLTTKETK